MTESSINQVVRILRDAAGTPINGGDQLVTFSSEPINAIGADEIGLALKIGTVTGTLPTLTPRLQMSFDGGATVFDTYPDKLNSEVQASMTEITDVTQATIPEVAHFWPNWFPRIAGFADTSTNLRIVVLFPITGTATPTFPLTAWLILRTRSGGTASA